MRINCTQANITYDMKSCEKTSYPIWFIKMKNAYMRIIYNILLYTFMTYI